MAASLVRATASRIRRGSNVGLVPGHDEEGKPMTKRKSFLGNGFGLGGAFKKQTSGDDKSDLKVDDLGSECPAMNKNTSPFFGFRFRNSSRRGSIRQQTSASSDMVRQVSNQSSGANCGLRNLISQLPSETLKPSESTFLNVARMQYLDGVMQARLMKCLKLDLVEQCGCSEHEATRLLNFILERAWQAQEPMLEKTNSKLEAYQRQLDQLKATSVKEITAAKDQARVLPRGAHVLTESLCVQKMLDSLAPEVRALVKACVEEQVKQGLAQGLTNAVEEETSQLRREVQKLKEALDESSCLLQETRASVDKEVKQRLSWSFGPLEKQVQDLEAQLEASEAEAAKAKEELAAFKARSSESAANRNAKVSTGLEEDSLFSDDSQLQLDKPCGRKSVFRASSGARGSRQVVTKHEITSAASTVKIGKALAVHTRDTTAKQSSSTNGPDTPKRVPS
eukprot:TRINITY_DN19851_c0_g2_i1.p1 TRINITY_DN19851_c0_g2~~TRINITY_DN19851_c0_g2_i1.p1  ORF type:complete len:452 (-),score=84.64 TRINITY_DN19851_c0_g2_i1:217-1572(-)